MPDPDEEKVTTCQWWMLCFNVATLSRYHPILGYVPICQRCDDKVKHLEGRSADA